MPGLEPWRWKALLAWFVTVGISYGLLGLIRRISEDTRLGIVFVVAGAVGLCALFWFWWKDSEEEYSGDEVVTAGHMPFLGHPGGVCGGSGELSSAKPRLNKCAWRDPRFPHYT
jgi:hypothetical protein